MFQYFLQLYDNLWWWVMYRTFKRYHVVKTGLKPGYHEIDKLMLHSNFSLLKRYVEDGLNCIDSQGGLHYLQQAIEECPNDPFYKEVRDLYLWWKVRRPQREIEEDLGWNRAADINEVLKYKEAIADMNAISEANYQEDTDMLLRLMKIRDGLWS